MHRTVIVIGLLLAGAASAESPVDIVDRAFAAISTDYQWKWAFTETETSDGATRVGRFDPRRPPGLRWSLLSVDGRVPSEQEVEAYLTEKADEDQDDPGGGDRSNDPREIVDIDSLELVRASESHWLFSFRPHTDDGSEVSDDFMRHVDGTLRIARDGHYLEYIDLRNDGPIRPALSVKINEFVTRLAFGPAAPHGPIVPKSITVSVRGRAALLISIDEQSETRYCDYEFVGD